MQLLLVEDDHQLGEATLRSLQMAAHEVMWLRDGESAKQCVIKADFDAIILDIGLPGCSGLEVLTTLRQAKIKTPVLILTARDNTDDRVRGLDYGADDYMTKPFEMSELLARLRAVTRRYALSQQDTLHHGDIALCLSSRTVTFHGNTMTLSRREFVLLKYFMENPGRVLSKQQIETKLYGWDTDVGSNTVEVHVHNLRKKFGTLYIRTLRGVGYMLVVRNCSPYPT